MKQESRATDIAIATPMPIALPRSRSGATNPTMAIAVLRIAFGLIWSVDAALKWQPAFQANFSQIVSGVAQGQPGFLSWWFGLWELIVSGRAPIFAVLAAITETYLALALIAGFARKFTYAIGIAYGLFVWSVDRKSTRLNSSHSQISYAVFCL